MVLYLRSWKRLFREERRESLSAQRKMERVVRKKQNGEERAKQVKYYNKSDKTA